jgi:hypothetical protein
MACVRFEHGAMQITVECHTGVPPSQGLSAHISSMTSVAAPYMMSRFPAAFQPVERVQR